MSDSSKPQQRSGATPIKNPLLSASVTGLTFDDFPNKPQLLPAAPPIVHAPPPAAVTPSALLGREHKSLVTVGSSSLDTENLDEINLNASAEDSVSSDHHADANGNSLLEQPSTSDSILSQAASSFSALPSVASNVFSSFSKRITAISSRETTPSNDAYDPNGNFVPQLDIQPNYTQQQPQQLQQPQYQQFPAANQGPPPNEPFYAPPPPQAGGNYYGSLPPTSAGLGEQQPPINLPPAEPPKFYTPGEVSSLPSAPPATLPPPSVGGQNNFRFGAKKKLYAPIPGLSDQQSPQAAAIFQPPATVSAPLTLDSSSQGANLASDPYGQPPASAPYLNEERKSEERKTIGGGLFSKISNLAPTGVLQNITGLVQSAAGTLTQTINPNSQSLQSNEQSSAPTNFGITFDSQQSGVYFAGVPPPPAANYFAAPNLGEQQQANYPPPPPATGEIFQGNPVAIQPPPPAAAAAVSFFNPSVASGAPLAPPAVLPPTEEANFFNPSAAPAVFDPFNHPSAGAEPPRPARPSSRPVNAFSETVNGTTLPGFTCSQQPSRPPSVASRPPSQPGSSVTPRPPSANEQTPVAFFNPLQTGSSATPQLPSVHDQGLVTFFNPLQGTTGAPQTLAATATSTPSQVGLFDPSKYTPNNSTIPPQSGALPASSTPTPPQVGLFDPSKYLPNSSTLPPQAGVHSTTQPSQLPPTSGAALPPPAAGHTSYRLQKGTKLYKNPLTAQETAPLQVTPNPLFGVAPPQAAFPLTPFAESPNVYAQASLPPTQADFQPFGHSVQTPSVTSVPANIFVPPTEAQSVPLFAPPAATEQIARVVEEPVTNTSVAEQVQQPQEVPLFVPTPTQQEIPAPIANPLLLASQENATTPIAGTDLNNPQSLAPPAESEIKKEEKPESLNLLPPSIPQLAKQEEATELVEVPQQSVEFPNSDYFFKPIEPVTEQFPPAATNQTVNFFGHNEESSQQFFKPIEAVVETPKLKEDKANQDVPLTTAAEQSHPSVDPLEQTLQNLNLGTQPTPTAVVEAPTTLAQLPPPPTQLGAGSGNPYRRGSAAETHKPLGAPPTLANFFTPAAGAASGSGDFNFFATLPSSGETSNAASNFFSSSPSIPEENTQNFFNTPTAITSAEASSQSQGFNFFAAAPPTTVQEIKPGTAATQSEETTSGQYLKPAEVVNSNEVPTVEKPKVAEDLQTTPYPLEDSSQNTATPGTPLFPALPTNVGIIPSVTESLENINKHPIEETSQTPSIGFENFLTSTNQTQVTSTNFFDSVAGNQQPPTTTPYPLDNTTTGLFPQLPTNIQTISSENKTEVFPGSEQTITTTTTGLLRQLQTATIHANSTDNQTATFLENQAEALAPSQTSTPTPYPSVNAPTALFPQLPQNIGIIPSATESSENIEQHQSEESSLTAHVPPPIGFENFTKTPQLPAQTEHTPLIQETPKQTQQPAETTSLVNNFSNFFNQTPQQQLPQLPNNTSSFFDNLAGQQPPPQQQLSQQPIARNSTAAVNPPTVSNEDQIIQNFFNNPPPKDADHVGDLNYDLVHSGLAIRNLQQRSLTPVSNLVEPPSSACSEFSTLNASETSIIKEDKEDNKAEDSAAAVDSNNTALTKHYEELPEEILKELRMANVLQGDKATAAPVASTSYKPTVKHWFYKRTVDGKQIWVPFSHYDSALLETSLVMEGDDKPEIVAVEGGRYDVNISERRKRSVYWDSEPIEVRRCSWFYKALDSKYIPYEESTADVLEAEYKQAAESGVWHKTIILGMGEQVVFHGPTVIVHFQQQHNQDAWGGTTQTTTRPRVVKRDLDDFHIAQGESQKVDHLLFMVHGIGAACDLKLRSVEEVVEDFRSIAHQLVQSHYKNSADLGLVGRVEVLPISWHNHLHSIELGIDEKLRSITLESIPKLRNFTNDTLLDILFYTSPTFCQRIMNSIVVLLNDIYLKYRQRHPEFNGGVSLAGHSLGSLIIFDLLCHQNPIKESEEKNLENPDQQFLTTSTTTTTSATGQLQNNQTEAKPISYTMGPAGTGQPFINYGQLIFQPKKFFALGSPIGMFVTIRGIDKLGLDFRLPTCPGFYNIFHPYDPVAYRIEALVNPDLSGTRPVLIPHHKGRKRMHLELKETMARVTTDLKHRFLDKFKNTFESVNIFAPSAKSKRETEELMEKEVEKVIEMQMQLERQGNQQQSQSQTPSQEHLSPSDDQHQPLAVPTLDQPLRTRTDSVSTVVSDDMVEVDFPLGKLNDSKRIDYVLQEAPLEFINEYIFALSSHVCYWDSEDTILFVMKEIYSGLGISPDSQVPQQTMTIERPNSRNSLSGP